MELRKELLTTIYNIGFACAESYSERENSSSYGAYDMECARNRHISELEHQKQRLANQLLNDANAAKYFGMSNGLEVFNELSDYINSEINAWIETAEEVQA